MRSILACSFLLISGCLALPGKIRPSLPKGEVFTTLPRSVELVSGKRYDCGAESLYGVMCYYQQPADFQEIADTLYVSDMQGTFPQKMIQVARARGFQVRAVEGSLPALQKSIDAGIPAIVMIRSSARNNHYLLATGYQKEKDLAVFEFYGGWKWIFTREELQEVWQPCGFLQLEFVLSPLAAKLDQARILEANGKVEEALSLYQEVLSADSGNGYARLGAGNCFVFKGSLDEAHVEYLAAYEAGFRDPELLNNLADISLAKEAFRGRALGWAQEAVLGFEKRLAVENSELGKAIWSKKLALGLGTLGAAQEAAGDRSAARGSYQRSLEMLGEEDSELRRHRQAQIEACGGA